MIFLKGLWDSWKNIKQTDPVKTRLVYAVFFGSVIFVPFLSIWAWLGLAKAVSAVFLIVVSACALFLLVALANISLGWVAHWIYTGQMNWFDMSESVLDEVESAKWRQEHPKKVKTVNVKVDSAQIEQQPVISQVSIGNNNVLVAGSIKKKLDDGPEWLRNKG